MSSTNGTLNSPDQLRWINNKVLTHVELVVADSGECESSLQTVQDGHPSHGLLTQTIY